MSDKRLLIDRGQPIHALTPTTVVSSEHAYVMSSMAISLPSIVPETGQAFIVRHARQGKAVPDGSLDRLTRLAARLLSSPVALVSLVEEKRQVFASEIGLSEPWKSRRETPISHSFCQHVVSSEKPVSVIDARLHPTFRHNPAIDDLGVVAYLGVPLRSPSGDVLGAVCVIDEEPRTWGEEDVLVLRDIAALATEQIHKWEVTRDLDTASAEVGRHQAMIQAFFETTPMMIGVTEILEDDIIHHLDNEATATFFGTTPEAMSGKRSTELGASPDTLKRWLAAYRNTIRTRQPVRFDYDQPTPEGDVTLAVTVSYIGLAQSGGPLCSYVAQDVTEARKAQEALRQSEHGLQLAMRAGRMGAWRVDLIRDEVIFTDELRRLYQVDDSARTLEAAFNVVHELDIDRLKREFREAIEETSATGEARDVSTEYRVRVGSETRWFRTVGRVYPNSEGPGPASMMAGTALDITTEKQHEASLLAAHEAARSAMRQAEATSRLKDSILHNMSHEIRTPLTAVIGYADLLGDESDEDNAEFAGYIKRASQQLLDTLNSVLEHARLEAGHGSSSNGEAFDLQPVDACSVSTAATRLFTQRAKDAGIRLHLDTEGEAWVQADTGALQRVIANLVSNALKFTPRGSVTVSIRREGLPAGGDVLITVADTGVGMSPEFLAKAFEPFHQESTGHARCFEGTGLGLSIVHRLVEMMGGSIRVESEQDEGSTFEVRLRASAPPQVAADSLAA